MLNLNSLIVFSENPSSLMDFYKKVLQKETKWSGGDFSGIEAGSGVLIIGPHDKVKGKNTQPERMIYNLETDDVEAEFARIKELGAGVVAEPYHPDEEPTMTLATLSDPDGNYFQLATPMK